MKFDKLDLMVQEVKIPEHISKRMPLQCNCYSQHQAARCFFWVILKLIGTEHRMSSQEYKICKQKIFISL